MKPALIRLTSFASLLTAIAAPANDPGKSPQDRVHGNVRCVLMSVGQTTAFPHNNSNEPPYRAAEGVPCLTITFLIERLGDAPFGGSALKQIEVSSGGKPLKLLRSGVGTYTKTFEYQRFPDFISFTKPAVAEPTRAIIIQHVEFAALPNLNPIDVTIQDGFDDDAPVFKFPSLKLQ